MLIKKTSVYVFQIITTQQETPGTGQVAVWHTLWRSTTSFEQCESEKDSERNGILQIICDNSKLLLLHWFFKMLILWTTLLCTIKHNGCTIWSSVYLFLRTSPVDLYAINTGTIHLKVGGIQLPGWYVVQYAHALRTMFLLFCVQQYVTSFTLVAVSKMYTIIYNKISFPWRQLDF